MAFFKATTNIKKEINKPKHRTNNNIIIIKYSLPQQKSLTIVYVETCFKTIDYLFGTFTPKCSINIRCIQYFDDIIYVTLPTVGILP